MILDAIKKNNLCRRCLLNWQAPHTPKECLGPLCGKCKGDHHTMICPKPTGVQVMAARIMEKKVELCQTSMEMEEETKLEEDPKGTKVMTKELQLATTKGAEQKTMGGVLIKATPDSMRSCYGNKKGQRDDKDTTISHAQDNNETREPNKEASNIERQDQEEGDNKVIEGAIIRTAEPQEKRKMESTGGKKVRQRHNVDAKNMGRSI